MRNRERKRKKKSKKEKENKTKRESVRRGEKKERKEKEERERKDFPAFLRSKFDSSKTKVGACSVTYMWTLKTWSFDKLHKVENFPTRFIFSLKAI